MRSALHATGINASGALDPRKRLMLEAPIGCTLLSA